MREESNGVWKTECDIYNSEMTMPAGAMKWRFAFEGTREFRGCVTSNFSSRPSRFRP